jgi:hypothetical protein
VMRQHEAVGQLSGKRLNRVFPSTAQATTKVASAADSL